MNKFLLLSVSAMLAFACNTANHDATAQDGGARDAAGTPMTSYGAAITPDNAIGMDELMKKMAGSDSMHVKVACEITASCAVKGCWMTVKTPSGDDMRVRFADYGFFVPKQGLEGRQAIIEGVATRETIDVATLRHYAQDAGKSQEEIDAITEPETSLNFLADGVLIAE